MQLPSFAEPALDVVPATTVAEWPEMTFLENLAFAPDGDLYVTHYPGAEIYRVTPGSWSVALHVRTEGFHPLGIAFAPDGSAVLSGHRTMMFDGRPAGGEDGFWRMSPEGVISHIADAPTGHFLNGLTPLGGARYACADSIGGQIWEVDTETGTARVLVQDALLAPIDPADPLPAANGIKVFDGHLYVSNWVKGLIVRAPILADGELGDLEVVAEELVVDDFAFAADGTLFGASHMASVVRLDPSGETRTIAGPAQGVAGCTAPAFGPDALYVITDGGTVAGMPEPARLVALDIGRTGAPLR